MMTWIRYRGWEEGPSYVVKITGCSVNVPATVNPKASPCPLLLTPCMKSSGVA